MMMKIATAAAILSAGFLAGCQPTSITAQICADAPLVQASGLQLNAKQQIALQSVLQSCAATSGGTSFANANVASALIADALLLQTSGLLSDVHIKALAPEKQESMQALKLRWEEAKP